MDPQTSVEATVPATSGPAKQKRPQLRGRPGIKPRGFHSADKQARASAPSKMPPPKALGQPSKVTENPVFSNSIFGQDVYTREKKVRKSVNINLASYTSFVREVYQAMTIRDEVIKKNLLFEAFEYYSTALLWLRIIGLRKTHCETLTYKEQQLEELSSGLELAVPEPLRLYLNAIGETVTLNGETFFPSFPALPANKPAKLGFGGFYPEAITSPAGINLYSEIPCLGITLSCLNQALNGHVGHWAPPNVPTTTPANHNLLGYHSIVASKQSAKAFILNTGYDIADVPEDISATGFCTGLVTAISDLLQTTSKTFAVTRSRIEEYPISGTRAQLVVSIPQVDELVLTRPFADSTFASESLNRDESTTFGIAERFLFQAYKEPLPEDSPVRHNVWSPLTYSTEYPIPVAVADARNCRRDIPLRFTQDVQFKVVEQNAKQKRRMLLDALFCGG